MYNMYRNLVPKLNMLQLRFISRTVYVCAESRRNKTDNTRARPKQILSALRVLTNNKFSAD